MPSGVSRGRKQLKRIKSFFKRKKKSSFILAPSSSPQKGKKSKPALAWSPEDIFDQMHGLVLPTKIHGSVLLIQVGGVDRGWMIDCRGDNVIISRYCVPEDQISPSRAPKRPPKLQEQPSSFSSNPWCWYKDRKVFSKLESGEMSETVAYVTGKIAVSGDSNKFYDLDPIWKEARERASERKKQMGPAILMVDEEEQNDENDIDEDDDIDEEARILASFKPEVEPKDPRTKEFWRRHFGTDMLVSSYLMLLSSIGFLGLTSFQLVTLPKIDSSSSIQEFSKLAHDIANAFAALFFAVGSVYLIKLSYPETMMLLAYRSVTVDPNTMSFWKRYFTANEMLIALWTLTFAFVIPYTIVALYELFILEAPQMALTDTIVVVLSIVILSVFNIAAMPDAMRMNNGRGSSFFYDFFWAPLLCLKPSCKPCNSNSRRHEDRVIFWQKHVGNDGLAGAWIWTVFGVLGAIVVTPLVILEPTSVLNWLYFANTMPFTLGSLLLLRASYPEHMNSSLLFKDEEESSVRDIGGNDPSQPLLL